MKRIASISNVFMHGIFILLMIMSIVLYKERMFADASYYLFHAINSQWFHVEHGRTVLALSQIFPILGTWLHLPLKVVLVLGSLGHEFFYYGVFLICLYLLKDKRAALVVIAVHVIGQLSLYWSPMLEICYGAGLSLLFYSILQSNKWKDDKWLIFMLVVQWFAIMSHPENFLLIGIAIAYHFLQNGFQKRIHLGVGIFTIVGFIIEILTFSEYEKGHSQLLGVEQKATALNLLDGAYLQDVIAVFTNFFFDLIALLVIALVYMTYRKRWKEMLLFIGSTLLLIVIVNQAQIANEYSRYNESMYNPLVFIVVFFFAYEVIGFATKYLRLTAIALLLIISFFRVGWIYQHGEPLRVRTAQLERLVDYTQTLEGSKYSIDSRNIYYATWANPIESLFYSALDGKEETISLVTSSDLEFEKNLQKLKPELFVFRRFELEELNFLNQQYFRLDTGNYFPLNTATFDKSIEAYVKNIQLELLEQESLKQKDSIRFLVKIINSNFEPLPSNVDEKLFISYHWFDEVGGQKVWDGKRTKLEVDVHESYIQTMTVILPEHEGNFVFVPDLLIEGKQWFNLPVKYNLKVD
tara:strand:+ start:246 stop:1988 length:1743 start_codon:yes stop_codon:yes gene_type:complete